VGGRFNSIRVDSNKFLADAGGSGGIEEVLNHHFRLLIFPFAEVVMPDISLRISEVDRRPVMVPERTPYRIVAIDRHWVTDVHVHHGPTDVLEGAFERGLLGRNAVQHTPVLMV